MSLAVLADHMASKGRGPDSMLIHMSPREVQGLQALAVKNGGSLTINPETGLPEAGFLDKLLPAIIGFALAPMTAGTSLAFLGATPFASALTVGALQTLRTGDIGKGIMAGFGAYGGAGLQAGLATAGGNILSGEATALAAEQAGNLASEQASQLGFSDAIKEQMIDEASQATASVATNASPFEKLSAGASQATSSPATMGQFAKDNFKNIAYAAGPILADQAVKANMPTTTTRPGAVRSFSYDPYGQLYTPTGNYEVPVKEAAGGGLMGMDDGGYNPGQLNFAQQSEPVMRMASGGIAGYAAGGVSDADILGWFNANPGADDTLIAQTMQQANVTPDQVARATGADYANVNERYLAATAPVAPPAPDTAPVDYFAQQFAPDVSASAATSTAAPAINSVEDLYTQILGRAPDAGGLAFWQQGFGNTIDANEIASFKNAAQAELANRTPAEQQALAPNLVNTSGGLNNLAAVNNITNTPAYTQYSAANIQDYIRANNLDAAGVTKAIAQFNADPTKVTEAQNTAATVNNIYRNVLGRDADPAGLSFWTDEITSGRRTGQEMYADFLKSAKSNTELGKFDMTLDQAATPYKGYMSADTGNIVDEWVRNTLGREVTAADKQQKWYKDASDRATMTTYDKAKDIYSNFQNYASKDAAASAEKQIANARTLLAKNGLTEMDVLKQTGKTIAELVGSGMNLNADLMKASQLLAPGKKAGFDFSTIAKAKVVPPVITPTGYYGNDTGNPLTKTPGDITTNKDGTVTVQPNIPGRPTGGFPGVQSVKDAYVEGGGSLGYAPYTPKTIEDFESKYNTLTGGSKQAYDYLTGKTKYSATPYTETGEVMKPYSESVLGVPMSTSSKKVLFDPVTKKYKNNPDYIPVSYTSKGEKVYGLSSKDIAAQLPDVATSNYEKWTKDNNVTLAQIAEALGISLAEAKKRYPKLSDKAATTTDDASGGGSNSTTFEGGGDANGGLMKLAGGGMAGQFNLGGYSDGGRLLRGPGDGVSDSIPATIGNKRPARLADGEFVVPARIVSELGNGSTEAGARKLYAMMDRVQAARRGTVGKGRVAKNSRSDKYLPA
jgi:hypothetical protein